MQFKQQESINFQMAYVIPLAISKLMAKIKFKNNIFAGLTIACIGLIATSQANAAYTFTDLGTLGGSESYANAINGSGQVAGVASTAGNVNQHATLWNGTTAIDLGTLGGNSSSASAINASGCGLGLYRRQSDSNRYSLERNYCYQP